MCCAVGPLCRDRCVGIFLQSCKLFVFFVGRYFALLLSLSFYCLFNVVLGVRMMYWCSLHRVVVGDGDADGLWVMGETTAMLACHATY